MQDTQEQWHQTHVSDDSKPMLGKFSGVSILALLASMALAFITFFVLTEELKLHPLPSALAAGIFPLTTAILSLCLVVGKPKRYALRWFQAEIIKRKQQSLLTEDTPMTNNPLSNIHITNNLIVDGDPCTRAKITCGFRVSGVTMENSSNLYRANVENALRSLFLSLSNEYELQAKLTNSGNYDNELEEYYQTTESKANDWSQSQRNWNFSQLHSRIEQGIINRKEVHIYVSRKIANRGKKQKTKMAAETMEALLSAESHAFDKVAQEIEHNFKIIGGKVDRLTDEELFHEYDKGLNPSISPYDAESAINRFDAERSISECCLHSDMLPSSEDDCSFYFDGNYHSILVLKALPSLTCSGIITQLSNLPMNGYTITLLTKRLDLEKEITKEEKKAQTLEQAYRSSDKARLRTSVRKSSERIDRLASGEISPFQVQVLIHVWDKDVDLLRNQKITMLKSAILRFHRAQYYLVENSVMGRNFYLSSMPGSPVKEKAFTHSSEDITICNLLPISSNHDNTLNHAEVIYQTSNNGIFGVSFFKNAHGDPYTNHVVIAGKTGYGKSACTIDLTTQLQPYVDTTFIVEIGESYGGYVSTFGKHANSFHIDPNGSDTFNYLDTSGLPLTHQHQSDVAAIIKLMIEVDERHLINKSGISELVYLFYREHYDGLRKKHPQQFQEVCRKFAIAKYYASTKNHAGLVSNIYPDYLEWQRNSPHECSHAKDNIKVHMPDIDEEDLFQFSYAFVGKNHMPTHAQFHDWLVKRNKPDEALLRSNLRNWRSDQGRCGCLFDGISTISFTGPIVHIELGRISDTDSQLKALAGFIISNYIRNTITTMPRSKRKLCVFEELGKFLTIENAAEIVADFYERGRKYNCVVVAVVQQITKIQPESLRNSILGNSSIALCFRQEDTKNAETLQQAFKLPEATTLALTNLPSPTKETGSHFICWQSGDNGPAIHSACNIVSPEMLYVVDSSGKSYEKRQESLAKYEDVLEGISIEANR